MSNQSQNRVLGEVKERAFRPGTKNAGQKYFLVEDTGMVIASKDKTLLDMFIDNPNRVLLGDENGGWRWVLGGNNDFIEPLPNLHSRDTVDLVEPLNGQTGELLYKQRLVELRTKLADVLGFIDETLYQ